jgi:hypothetical protein
MAGDPAQELYRRFELEVRTPQRRLLIDALLPDPASLPSALPVIPVPAPVAAEDLAFLSGERPTTRDSSPEDEAPRPRRKPRSAPARRKEGPKSLEEEVAEFMNRDRSAALAPDSEDPATGGGGSD